MQNHVMKVHTTAVRAHPVAGEAVGVLREVASVEEARLAGGEDTVLLVKGATGDEEVGAMGGALKGVILCHSLPHLSHLGASSPSPLLLHTPLPLSAPAPTPHAHQPAYPLQTADIFSQ